MRSQALMCTLRYHKWPPDNNFLEILHCAFSFRNACCKGDVYDFPSINCWQGDFVEADEQQPRSVGGRKRKPVSVESLMRKRVAAPDDGPAHADGTEYLRWLLSG